MRFAAALEQRGVQSLAFKGEAAAQSVLGIADQASFSEHTGVPVRSESATGLGSRGRNKKMRGLLVVVQALCLFAVVAAKPKLPSDANKVSIGIDCGSSGSRVCIYYYDQDPHDLVAFEDSCYSIRPGLSSFAGNTQAAGKYLKPLYDHALSLKVPKGTKVYLAATAGLRALPNRGDIDGIISSVQSYLQEHYSPQLVWAERYPRVLSGNEEGVFGWAAVNHMLGQLGSPDQSKTVGTLDMGGSSTQITFVAHDQEDIPDGYKFILPFKGQMYHLYTHSFAGYGYNDAHSSILKESEKVSSNTGADVASTMTTLIDPCTLSGYTADLEVDGQKVALSGTGSWGDCTTRCKLLLSRGWPCVSIPGGTGVVTSTGNRRGAGDVSARGSVTASCGGVGASGDTTQSKVLFVEPISKSFYALSNFRDIERALGFDDVATVGQMATTGRDLCRTPWHKLRQEHPDLEEKELSTYCFGASYVYSILHDGYHFPDDLKVHFAKRIDVPGMDKVKVSWTRGMILYETLNSGAAYASTGGLGSSDTVGASDSGDGDSSFVANVLLVGMFAAAITMAAGIALVRSPTLKDRLSEGMTRGMEKGAEASEWAGEAAESAARAGKRLATNLPSELPFDVPSVFRKAAHKGGYGEMSEDGGAGAGLKGGVAMKDYGSIEDGRSGGKDPTDERSWGRALVRVFPQLARGGTGEEREPIAARGASGFSHVEVVADNFKPEGAGAASGGGGADEGGNMCIVCDGRRKNGVVGKCGLCMARKDEDKD